MTDRPDNFALEGDALGRRSTSGAVDAVPSGINANPQRREKIAKLPRIAKTRPGYRPHAYSMNQPWLTMSDWPVSAFELKPAKNSAASATVLDRGELAYRLAIDDPSGPDIRAIYGTAALAPLHRVTAHALALFRTPGNFPLKRRGVSKLRLRLRLAAAAIERTRTVIKCAPATQRDGAGSSLHRSSIP